MKKKRLTSLQIERRINALARRLETVEMRSVKTKAKIEYQQREIEELRKKINRPRREPVFGPTREF